MDVVTSNDAVHHTHDFHSGAKSFVTCKQDFFTRCTSRSLCLCLSAFSVCCVSVLPVHTAPYLHKECVNLVAETSKKKNCRHRPSPWVVFDEFLMLVVFDMSLMRLNLFSFALECPPIHLCNFQLFFFLSQGSNSTWSASAPFHTLVLISIQEFQCSFVFPSRGSISSVSIHCYIRYFFEWICSFYFAMPITMLTAKSGKSFAFVFTISHCVNRPEDTIHSSPPPRQETLKHLWQMLWQLTSSFSEFLDSLHYV